MPLDNLTASSILSAGMLATLNISTFSGVRVDRDVTEKVAADAGTDANDTGKFNKQIIGKHSLEAIHKVATAARTTHYQLTLPWSDAGQRLLSAKGFRHYVSALGTLQQQFQDEVEAFIKVYPDLIEKARSRLNTLFNEADYPSIAGMRARFEFGFRFSPVPSSGNWFLDGLNEEMDKLRASVESHVDDTVRAAVRDVYNRVADQARHVHDRLTNYEVDPETGKVIGSVFRDSLIDNLKELVELLPSLNITSDPELDEIGAELRQITRYSAKALRADTGFRREAAERAKKVFDRASMILG